MRYFIKKLSFGCFLVFCCTQLSAQTPFEIGLQGDYGFIYKHSKKIGHLITNHPHAFTLSINKYHRGKKEWEERFKYPKTGLALTYFDYGNELLGKTYALSGNIFFPFTMPSRKYELEAKLGTGVCYATNPFDIDDNFRNSALSNRWVFLMQTGFYFNYKLNQRLHLKSALQITHYSSAAFKQPNNGINMVTLSAGAAYQINPEQKQYVTFQREAFVRKTGFNVALSGSLIETEVNQPKKHRVVGLMAYLTRDINRANQFNVGFDLSMNEGIRYQIDQKALRDSTFRAVDYKRLGLVAGHELKIGKAALLTQVGYYVYRQFEAKTDQAFFQRYGMKYYFLPSWYGALSLKTHAFTAECAEFTVGYKWEK